MARRTLSRWQQFYQDDPELASIAPSSSANQAAKIFTENNSQIILDLGCGTGRDSIHLANGGVTVIGADAASSGLRLAQQRAAVAQRPLSWVEADARLLPFAGARFDGVYCFGLLHEFVGEAAVSNVNRIMAEIHRVLKPMGVAVVAVAAGDPEKGLPHVQNFTEEMFDEATSQFHCLEKRKFDDLGCTGRTDYKVWFGHFIKN